MMALPSFSALSVQELALPFTETTPELDELHVQSFSLADDGVKATETLSDSPAVMVLLSKPNVIPATGTRLVAGSTY